MVNIPDCPGGMGNANDWIKAREALGYPQNRTVSYEYTTYENNNSNAVEQIERWYKEKEEYGKNKFKIGFEWGYAQALEDLKKIQNTDRTPESVKRILRKTKCPISINNRFLEIKKVTRINESKKS